MSKKISIITIVLFIIFSLFSCNNLERKERNTIDNLESLSNFVINSKTICDTILNLKSKESKLLICTQEIGKSGRIIELTESCIPFRIKNDFIYKKINGLDVIFYDFEKPLDKKQNQNEIESLIKKNIIKIEPNNNWICCKMPYYIFSTCNKSNKLNCYDFETKVKIEKEYFKSRKVGGSISTYNLLCAHCE